MILSVAEIRRFYLRVDFDRYDWRFRRKHFRLETLHGKWVKLNKQRSISVTRLASQYARTEALEYLVC
jgi:hypothetical protein